MRKISSDQITEAVALLCQDANCYVPQEVFNKWLECYKKEKGLSKDAFAYFIKNAVLSWQGHTPLCQDTGQMVFLIELGQDVHITGNSIEDAVNKGVEIGGKEGFLRKSVVKNPFERDNQGFYGPAVIHYILKKNDRLIINLMPSGCGSEHMNAFKTFTTGNEEEKITEFAISTVKKAGSRPCPPIILGIGIGGDMSAASLLAKKALFRGVRIKKTYFSCLEERLLKKINKLGIGPMGFGGKTTALSVNIEYTACHRAHLTAAIAFNCYLSRARSIAVGEAIKDKTGSSFVKKMEKTEQSINLAGRYKPVLLPLTEDITRGLRAGDRVKLSGTIYSARDAAHIKLVKLLNNKKNLPVNLKGGVIYYAGPCPARHGHVIGPVGPTTSLRMDKYTEDMLKYGIKAMIGKGHRSPEIVNALKRYKAIYFTTIGGIGTLLSKCVRYSEIAAFPELGCEAIRRLEVEDFPAIVCNDIYGVSLLNSME